MQVFAPLSQGVAALRAGNDEAARTEFEKVIQIDRFNPYALNNLAVLAEKQGQLKEAMSYLLDAETYAAGIPAQDRGNMRRPAVSAWR